jgi:hypothetical protein
MCLTMLEGDELAQPLGMLKMAGMDKTSPEEVAKAFRKIAKDLGCDKSEERFRDTLFILGTQKIGDAPKPAPKRRSGIARSGKATDQNRN